MFPFSDPADYIGFSLVEFCAGMGGFSLGSTPVGFKTAVMVDCNPLACRALRDNFKCPIIQGDIQATETLIQVHENRPSGRVQVTAGFPCQPYSRQGDGLGLHDARGGVLHGIVRGAWLLQASSLLLECVANVVNFPEVGIIIQKYAEHMDMHVSSIVFDLQDQWPVRRQRYWCLLISKEFPCPELKAWPRTPCYNTIGSIMPLDALWDDDLEDELAWDQHELEVFFDSIFGSDKRILEAHDIANTVLHSWGNLLRSCPCHCRGPLSSDRLRRGGARGFGLVSATTGKVRHLHPAEGALICTVDPSYVFDMSPRAALCLLGQLAAPLQVLWLQAHVQRALQEHTSGTSDIDPLDCLQAYQKSLIDKVRNTWETQSMALPRQLSLEEDHHVYEVTVYEPTTAGMLLLAEKELRGWGQLPRLFADGKRINPDHFLHADVLYTIEVAQCHQLRTCPQPSLTTEITGHGCPDSGLGLGDKMLWRCVQHLLNFAYGEQQPGQLFVIYPFRAMQVLSQEIHPMVLLDWQRRYEGTSGGIALFVEHCGHWVVLHASPTTAPEASGLLWTLFDGQLHSQHASEIAEVAYGLAVMFSDILGRSFRGFEVSRIYVQRCAHTCGTLALAHLAYLTNGGGYTDDEEEYTHNILLNLQHELPDIEGFGSDSTLDDLTQLLHDKGVPRENAQDRAKQVLAKLGPQHVRQCLSERNPWAALKAAASKPGTMFRLVTTDELNRYVASRAKGQHGADIRNHKQKKKTPNKFDSTVVQVDPSRLVLNSEHFQDEDDEAVPQISFAEVEADQRGIALCTLQQAYPFLEMKKSISTDALALVLVDTPADDVIQASGLTKIACPAYCPGTGEHTLIFGWILQLGDLKVFRSQRKKITTPEIVKTCVIKLQVYKDQYDGDWVRFAQAPIRSLVTQMDALKLCDGKACGADCPRFHPGLDESIDNVLFEVWARSFFNDKGARCEQAQAISFSVFVRVPDGACHGILVGTPGGVYAEPRGDQPKQMDDRYRVIWLPGDGPAEALHKSKTCGKTVCLVRMRNKYGIRVCKEDEAVVWAQLKPGIEYVNLSISQVFELSPVPHGTQRTTIAKLLKEWGWAARPMQPGRGSITHMSWRVGSDKPPPQMVLPGFDGDVVISPAKDFRSSTPVPKLIASTKTQKHLAAAPSSSSTATDPWLQSSADPWAKPASAAAASTNAGKSRLTEIKEQLCEDVTQKVRKALEAHANTMEVDSDPNPKQQESEQRLQALEVGMTEIKQQNAQFLTWFHQAGDRMQANEKAVEELQTSMVQQQQELQQLNANVSHTVKNMKDDLSREMANSFQQQMTDLTALLEKRQCRELPH
eukprot:Skav206885  [mRNA]  locus=scaffold3287:68732:72739:+ [translate_table: standard]